MKLDYLKQKQELVPVALLGVSALMTVLILYQVAEFFVASARAENVVKTALEQINTEAQDVENYFTKDREIANSLTMNNLFAPPPPRENPVKEVRAILGNKVFINNQWYSEGQTIPGDATIVAIEPTQVRIEWDGTQSTFRPIDASTPTPQQSGRETGRAGSSRQERPDMVVVGSQPTPIQGRTVTREQPLQDMRQNWQRMSDAERERLRNEMRQRFGGNRAFGGRGGFFGGRQGGRRDDGRGGRRGE